MHGHHRSLSARPHATARDRPAPRRTPLGTLVLTAAVVLAITYATLYPFSGWRPWSSLAAVGLAFAFEPWPRYWTRFDVAINVAMYFPLGLLLTILFGRRLPAWAAALLAALLAASLSLTLEWIQTLLPGRVPSRLDWTANSVGAAIGATCALAVGPRRIARWSRANWHRSPLDEGAALGLVLLSAWLVVQAAPQVIGFASGRIPDAALAALGFGPARVDAFRLPLSFSQLAEGFGVFLTALAIGGLVRAIVRPGARWLPLAIGCLFAAAAVRAAAATWLPGSRAPLFWLAAATQGGLLLAIPALVASGWLPRRHAITLGLVALVAVTILHNVTPASDYHRTTVAAADHGQWANVAGLIEGVAIAWPYAAIVFLAVRLARMREAWRL